MRDDDPADYPIGRRIDDGSAAAFGAGASGPQYVVLRWSSTAFGCGAGGQWCIFMHGGHRTFHGKLGLEYSAPDDPMGLKKLHQLEQLCIHHAELQQAAMDDAQRRLAELDEGSRERLKVLKELHEAEMAEGAEGAEGAE